LSTAHLPPKVPAICLTPRSSGLHSTTCRLHTRRRSSSCHQFTPDHFEGLHPDLPVCSKASRRSNHLPFILTLLRRTLEFSLYCYCIGTFLSQNYLSPRTNDSHFHTCLLSILEKVETYERRTRHTQAHQHISYIFSQKQISFFFIQELNGGVGVWCARGIKDLRQCLGRTRPGVG